MRQKRENGSVVKARPVKAEQKPSADKSESDQPEKVYEKVPGLYGQWTVERPA